MKQLCSSALRFCFEVLGVFLVGPELPVDVMMNNGLKMNDVSRVRQ